MVMGKPNDTMWLTMAMLNLTVEHVPKVEPAKLPQPNATWIEHKDIIISNYTISWFNFSSPQQCQQKCDETEYCKSVTFFNGAVKGFQGTNCQTQYIDLDEVPAYSKHTKNGTSVWVRQKIEAKQPIVILQ